MKSGISFHSSTLFTPSSIPQGKSMGSVKYSLMILKINKVWNGMKTMKMDCTYNCQNISSASYLHQLHPLHVGDTPHNHNYEQEPDNHH